MKKIIFNLFTILLTVSLLFTVTYGWWISGSLGEGIVIKSAKINSIILLEKGVDFNLDGNLDLDLEGNERFEEITRTRKSTEQVLVLTFEDLIPTQVYTWRVTVTNKGDVRGYVYASLFEEIDFNDGISEQENLIRFLSISRRIVNEDGSYTSNKVYLKQMHSEAVLFGGTDEDVVNVDESVQYVFQIELEPFEVLLNNNVCELEDYEAYQKLQGKVSNESFKFLDISLSSEKPLYTR